MQYEDTRAHMLAREGYYAFVADMHGDVIMKDSARRPFNQWLPYLFPMILNQTAFVNRVLAGVKAAASQPSVDKSKIALIGYW